jgi:lysozyme family protein
MKHPYAELRQEYATLLASLSVTRPKDVNTAAQLILRRENISRYASVERQTGVPAAFIGALDYRESTCNPMRALGQGDRWDRVSVNVPRGKGPFKSWEDAAVFYVKYDKLNENSAPWTMEYACWKGEIWNGFGPRNHGKHTGYLWSGTNAYKGGNSAARIPAVEEGGFGIMQ